LPPVGDKKADPDLYIREKGADAYLKQVKEAPPYVDYLIRRASRMDLTTGEGKVRALNYLAPYLQKIPNRLLRSEWATRIAQQLHVEEPVLRAAFSKAAAERRSEVKLRPELVRHSAKPAERRLIRMLAEAEGFRRELAQHLQNSQLYHGLETEKIFAALIVSSLSGEPFDASEVGAMLEDRERRLFFEILFEESQEPLWEEAQSCLETLARKQIERELTEIQRGIEANPAGPAMRELLTRKQELMRRLAAAG
jgi:DNA primase